MGNDKNQTYVSGSAVNAKGIVPNNKYHRYNAMVRNTTKFFNDKLTMDLSASYVREYYNNMLSYGTYFNPFWELICIRAERILRRKRISNAMMPSWATMCSRGHRATSVWLCRTLTGWLTAICVLR